MRGGARWCLTPPHLLLRPTTSCFESFKPIPHTTLLTTLSFQTSTEA